jgi:hypothetical protein
MFLHVACRCAAAPRLGGARAFFSSDSRPNAAAVRLSQALFDQPSTSPAWEANWNSVYAVDGDSAAPVKEAKSALSSAGGPGSAGAAKASLGRTRGAVAVARSAPGALGPHKLVIDDLPKGAGEDDVLQALAIDFDSTSPGAEMRRNATVAVVGGKALSGDATGATTLSELDVARVKTPSAGAAPASAPFAVEFFVDRLRGRQRLNAFAYFVTDNDVHAALGRAAKFGVYVRGQRCSLYPVTTKTVLFVAGLPFSDNDHALRHKLSLIRDFPKDYVVVAAQRGCTFLNFPTHEEAVAAFALLLKFGNATWERDVYVHWASEQRNERASLKELTAQVTRLQAENYRLRLELAERNLQLSHAAQAPLHDHDDVVVAGDQRVQAQQQTTATTTTTTTTTGPRSV